MTRWYVLLSLSINVLLVVVLAGLYFLDNKSKSIADLQSGSRNYSQPVSTNFSQKNTLLLGNPEVKLSNTRMPYEDIRLRLSSDSHLELIKHRSPEFKDSLFKKYLDRLPGLNLFFLIDFKKPIEYKELHRLKSAGIHTIKPDPEYMDKQLGLFYGRYKSLIHLRGYPHIQAVYLLKKFTGEGNYVLDFVPGEDVNKMNVNFHLPYTKPGRTLLQRTVTLGGISPKALHHEKIEGEVLYLTVDVRKSKKITLYTKLKYIVDVENLLKHHVRVAGEITVDEYRKKMIAHPDYAVFTSTSEKIVFSDYIDSLASQIKPGHTLIQVWDFITKNLDEDIKYDYDKRHQFFSGKKVYHNIKDMYMTAAQLGETKVGACPERSSMEAAILRRIGIASRTATRLYHIYTEVLLPEQNWATTSGNVREIPLCESKDEKQSYFVSWLPESPVRLKWTGHLYPSILY